VERTHRSKILRRSILPVLGLLALIAAAALLLVRCTTISVPPSERLATYGDEPYRRALAACVRDGLVDYQRLRAEHADDLDLYLDTIARFGPRSTPDLFPGDDDRLAYYVNAYNALMLRQWLDGGAGADQAERSVNRLWFFTSFWRVDGSWMSLDQLEQSLIRPTFEEPRIHVALVCGAMGCPPLLEEPFVGEHLDRQLDDLARRWLREPDGLRLRNDGAVVMSAIFDWYRADFDAMGGLAGVIERFLDEGDERREVAIAAAQRGDVRFMAYDWSINRAPDE
jgi:hypothetical protein